MSTSDTEQPATTTTFNMDPAPEQTAVVPAPPADPPANVPPDEDVPMTLQEHLRELRDRLIKTVLGIAVGMGISFFFAQRVYDYFFYVLKRSAPAAELVVSTPTEGIVTFLQIVFYLGMGFAMPVIVFQLIRFLAPGLTRSERRYVYSLLPFIMLFFLLGAAFSSFIAIPNMLHFLLAFGDPRLKQYIRIDEMLGFFSNLSLWTGIVFEMPIVMFLLASLGVVSYDIQRKSRKYASVGLMILAAVITPTPDPLNMIIVWAPMYVLYELGILLSRFATRRRAAKPA